MYSITKEQILELENGFTLFKLKEWFPEVFETKLSSKFTGWAKCEEKINIDWLMYFENGLQKYGFDASNQWAEMNSKVYLNGDEIEATEQEVETALENEAIKRGYINGNYKCLYLNDFNNVKGLAKCYEQTNDLMWLENGVVYKKGVWATIIPTITKKEAEEKLGVKII